MHGASLLYNNRTSTRGYLKLHNSGNIAIKFQRRDKIPPLRRGRCPHRPVLYIFRTSNRLVPFFHSFKVCRVISRQTPGFLFCPLGQLFEHHRCTAGQIHLEAYPAVAVPDGGIGIVVNVPMSAKTEIIG